MKPTHIPSALLLACVLNVASAVAQESARSVSTNVNSLLAAAVELQGVPFSDVILSATGKHILPLNPTNALDRELLGKLSGAADRVLRELNATEHPAHQERRINEVSAHFERALRAALNAVPGFVCDVPKTAAGRSQRAGYPDLRLLDTARGRVVYLDPKLFERGSRASSLRTFYYEPQQETGKVLEDAHHVLIGFEHAGKVDGHWQFLGWELVDLSRLKLRLKAEFQGSNRDLYRSDTIVGRSGP